MKKYWFFIAFACVTLVLTGCSSSKKASKTPIKTFVMPCSDMVSGDGVLRAWASGKSDSEMSARKKAQVSAAAELASMLDRAVKATTEEYTSNLSESDLEILTLMVIDELQNKEIAQVTGIPLRTIERKKARFKKLFKKF